MAEAQGVGPPRPEDPRSPAMHALLDRHRALMASLYPAEVDHALPAAGLADPGIRLLACFEGDRPVACAAPAIRDGHGEAKSMFVAPEARGAGLGRRLLAELETLAHAEGLPRLMLETGDTLHAARRPYAGAGFTERAALGGHPDDPRSVFMEKRP